MMKAISTPTSVVDTLATHSPEPQQRSQLRFSVMRRALAAVFITAAFGAAQAQTVDIYVDRGAGTNDLACGSQTTPCKTIAYVTANLASSGDQVLLVGTTPFRPRGVFITNDLTIRGLGRDATLLHGGDLSRHFTVESGATLALEQMSLARGFASNGCGGSVDVDLGRLEVRGVRFAANSADCGGAVYVASGSLHIEDSEFVDNEATQSVGGAVYCENRSTDPDTNCDDVLVLDTMFDSNRAETDGGAMYTMANTTIRRSDYHANSGFEGGALHFVVSSIDTLNIKRSQFSANEAEYGGAVYAKLSSGGGKVEVRRSSFHANFGEIGGAMYLTGVSQSPDSLEVINSTFVENQAGIEAGAISGNGSVYFSTFVDQVAEEHAPQDLNGNFNLYRSLITKLNVPQGADECGWPALNGASNLTDGSSCGSSGSFRNGAHDNATFAGFGLWGGRTLSYRLRSDSNAVNEADNCGGANGQVQTDQRGAVRPAAGSECDIGAFEYQP